MKLGISIKIDVFNQKASGNFKTMLKNAQGNIISSDR